MADATDILRANLAALRKSQPALAGRIEVAAPALLEWVEARSGLLTAAIEHGGRKLSLASHYDPVAEAAKLCRSVDLTRDGCVVALGMGLGYHVQHLAEELGQQGLLIVFEPDVALLRAVFERIDHSAWLGKVNVFLADASTDRAGLINGFDRFTGFATQGTALVTHPPTRQRFAEELSSFSKLVVEVLGYCRTQVATLLVNASRTYTNFLNNVGYYAAGATTNELHNIAEGYPAVCVSAGPSLARNIDLLRDATVRENVVVITAQTTLKVLLAHGIEPDFVTALDYAEISRRFYESLPPLERATLIAEPLANAAILDSYPGPIRTTQSRFLDKLCAGLVEPRVPITCGATVAHLSFYVAQHLGCDPIMLIGQDLGFSDGLYYCPGTAIHDVWMPELGPLNTLENMEWTRIVRHRGLLTRQEDVHGQPIYVDEQMSTYLKQFERDFASVKQQVIDCTEGGSPKAHAKRMPLAEALATYATRPLPMIPRPPMRLSPEKLKAVSRRIDETLDEIRALLRLSRDTMDHLRGMLEHQDDRSRMARLFDKIEANKKKVFARPRTFSLINEMNAMGQFNRNRADRGIRHGESDHAAKERRQIERDLQNVNWIVQTCEEAIRIFSQAQPRLERQRRALTAPQRETVEI